MLVGFDAVLLSTDHDRFDYELIREHSDLVVDTRGKYKANISNIIKA